MSLKLLKSLIRIAAGVALGMFLLLTAGIGCANDLIFHPPERSAEERAAWPPEQLLEGDGFQVAVLLLEAASDTAPVLLYSHGNAEDLYDLEQSLGQYTRHGLTVAAYDYEGYGASPGKPTESNCYRDIERAYRWLTEERGIAPERIYAYGRSVGSGPACYLAENFPVAGLILEAPFKSAFQVVTALPLPFDRFPNDERLKKISVPILILTGTRDQVIDPSHSRDLAAIAADRCKLVWIEGAGHNDVVSVGDELYWRELLDFCREETP